MLNIYRGRPFLPGEREDSAGPPAAAPCQNIRQGQPQAEGGGHHQTQVFRYLPGHSHHQTQVFRYTTQVIIITKLKYLGIPPRS